MTLESSPFPPDFYHWRLSQELWQQARAPSPLPGQCCLSLCSQQGFQLCTTAWHQGRAWGILMPWDLDFLILQAGSTKKTPNLSFTCTSSILPTAPPSIPHNIFLSHSLKSREKTEKGQTIKKNPKSSLSTGVPCKLLIKGATSRSDSSPQLLPLPAPHPAGAERGDRRLPGLPHAHRIQLWLYI